jgi:transcriptional regulator with XRE-family HTH domain
MPRGKELAAARVLAGLSQKKMAELAKLDVSTIVRMESSIGTARGHLSNVEKVLIVLGKEGVEIGADGSIRQLLGKPRR